MAIPFDISDDDLMNLLPQINGVLFTGGGLDLNDPKTGEPHQYVKTAGKIMAYSISKMDFYNETWPILGIC